MHGLFRRSIAMHDIMTTTASITDQDFLRAAFTSDAATVEAYIAQGGDVNVRGKRGQTALMLAIWGAKSPQIANLLLNAGADHALREESSGWRPLTYAAVNGLPEIITMLVEHGDSVDPVADYKALLYAAQYRSHDCVAMLLELGANVDVVDEKGRTSLMRAARNSDERMVALLLAADADVSVQDCDGQTALMHAAAKASVANVRALLDAGCDPFARNHAGEQAIDIARAKKKAKIVAALER